MTDKRIIDQFISKYHLGGTIERVKWVSDKESLKADFINDSQNLVGSVISKNFKFPIGEFGIYSTSTLSKMLGILENEVMFEVAKEGGTPARFNINKHRLEMKTECTIRSGFFSGKRRYAQYITKKEGMKVEDIDVKGLDFMKSNFPPLFKKFFNGILNKILFGATRSEIDLEILEFKNSLNELPLEMLGKPTGVKDIKKYVERPPGAGNIFTVLKTGAPVNVKAAVRYNDFLRFKGLDKQHSQIVQGDKIKWVYLKDNPYKIDTMGFLDFDFPEGIRTFVETYIDRDKAFDSILKNKLETFYKDLSWGSLTLNTHVNNFFSF